MIENMISQLRDARNNQILVLQNVIELMGLLSEVLGDEYASETSAIIQCLDEATDGSEVPDNGSLIDNLYDDNLRVKGCINKATTRLSALDSKVNDKNVRLSIFSLVSQLNNII